MKTIKREALVNAVKILGLEPRDVELVAITPNEIRVCLFERSEDGQKVLRADGNALRRVEVYDVVL